jgi:hypothetical protein
MGRDPADIAALIRFPVLVIEAGVSLRGRIDRYSGSPTELCSVSVHYGDPWSSQEASLATHHPDPDSPFQLNLRELVEDSFAGWSVALQQELPPRPPEPPPGVESRYEITTTVLDDVELAPGERERKADKRARRTAVERADKRPTKVVIDGRLYDGHLIQNADLWALGFSCDDRGLTSIITARHVRAEDLKLAFITELHRFTGNAPRPSQ